jgi:uncharacterized RDD family membrane protein YckC
MRNFSARETEWLEELDGIELASFKRRAAAFLIDWIILGITISPLLVAGGLGYMKWREIRGHPIPDSSKLVVTPGKVILLSKDLEKQDMEREKLAEEGLDLLVPVLYFGLLTWKGKGRSPGKRLMKIRVVSLVHRHLTLWHSVERALGYGAAALEGGFGFVQFFIHPYRRCVQDRIAETIVVTEQGYQAMQTKSDHPLLPDEGSLAVLHALDEAPASTP